MIHAHVEVVKNIKNAIEPEKKNNNFAYHKIYE
jgi:hypothetical protein